MAFTLTESKATAEDLLQVSFPILKWEEDADGDLIVKGIATDGTVDSDEQIVDPTWSAKALNTWSATGANVRQSHDPRHPVGKGLSVEIDKNGSGKHWVTSVIVDPLAQKLVKKGVLTAYSIGISRPVIKHDPSGRARGGIITGGELAELSIVDRPSNKSSYLEIAKSAGDGSIEFTGKMFADDDVIAKFAGTDLPKFHKGGLVTDSDGSDLVPFSADMSLTFTPNDLAKILKSKIIEQHYEELALKAKESVADPTDTDSNKESTIGDSVADATPEVLKDEVIEAVKEAEPEVTKDPEDTEATDEPGNKAKKPAKGKKMPPWLNKPDSDDSSGDDSDDSCKEQHAHTEKCTPSGTPQSASGATDAAPMEEIPNTGPAPESPMPAGRKTPDTKGMGTSPEASALLRFKSIGIDSDLGRIHDLTCPAFNPEDVHKYHPFSDLSTVIDLDVWQRKAVDAASGPYGMAMEMTKVWDAAQTLKSADLADLNDFRAEMHKAFRDANPGVSSYPSPGAMSPSGYNRPVITAGHATLSPGYDGPNSSPEVATSAPHAGSFNRPPLGSGQQSPSPSFMKNDGIYPDQQGVPVNLTYLHIEKDKARRALSMMHDHLSHQFPLGCPMVEQDAYRQPTATPIPQVEGLGKTIEPEVQAEVVSKAPVIPQEVLDSIEKGMKKKLGKKVLAGKMTVDEARSKMGRMRAQKMLEWQTEDQLTKGEITREDAMKALGFEVPEVAKSTEPVIIKSAPESVSSQSDIIKAAIAEAIAPLMETVTLQKSQLAEQQKTLEALADQPDPTTSSWRGLALKSARPAGVTAIAENAERTQAIKRQLNHTWRTSENAHEREAAWTELTKFNNNPE